MLLVSLIDTWVCHTLNTHNNSAIGLVIQVSDYWIENYLNSC